MNVAIIDYNMGNLFSVQRALSFIGVQSTITNNSKEILEADAAILPGVGAFGEALNNLETRDLIHPILDFVDSGKPFLGICLGMQLLFTESFEFGFHKGLDIVEGSVVCFNNRTGSGKKVKVPHISWNQINKVDNDNWDNSILNSAQDGSYMYFVHSFYAIPEHRKDILTESHYGGINYCSGILKDNITAFQFHPEKSGKDGLRILKLFKDKIKTVSGENTNDREKRCPKEIQFACAG